MVEAATIEPEPKIYQGVEQDWEVVIGMEVHAQIASESKLFSGRIAM